MASLEVESEAPALHVAAAPAANGAAHEHTGSWRRRGALVRRSLLTADLLAIASAFGLTFLLVGGQSGWATGPELAVAVASLPAWIALASLNHLYGNDEQRTNHRTTDDLAAIIQVATVGNALFYGGLAIALDVAPDLDDAALTWALAIVFLCAGRALARTWCLRQQAYVQRTVIVGAGLVGQRLARKVLHHPEYGIELVGFVDDAPRPKSAGLDRLDVLGGTEDLLRVVREHGVERVVVAFSGAALERTIATTRELSLEGVRVDIVPRLFDLVGPSTRVDMLEAFPVLAMEPAGASRVSDAAKRTLDLGVASLALLLTAPLFAFIAWRVRRDSPGPVLFRQTRLGLDQREFTALKFRTMRTDVDTDAHRAFIAQSMDADAAPTSNGLFKLDQAASVTRSGRWLRSTSLDELPQLINVLRGEMSIVGPRPCIPYETANFEPHHFERFRVRPGITGLWQVTARAHSTFAEALDMDVAYARGRSFALDMQLLLRTPSQLLGRGVTR